MIPPLHFTIVGPPVGKGRPRFNPKNPTRRPFTPRKTRDYEKLVGQLAFAARLAWAMRHGAWPLDATYRVTVRAFTKNRVQPDLINVKCSVLDGAQKVLWNNDRQVKRGGRDDEGIFVDAERPRCEVSVEVIG